MIPVWALIALVFGVNFTIWGVAGLLRIVDGALDSRRRLPRNAGSQAHRLLRADTIVRAADGGGPDEPVPAFGSGRILTVADVAVLMAAHNEEVVIDDSLAAITALVPAANVHVVSDASTDRTVELARRRGVNVTETAANVGKAGALEEGIRVFRLVGRFSVVLMLDADTRLDPEYFEQALPLFDDPGIVAVAGCAHSAWNVPGLSYAGRLVTAHRSRIYALTQRLLKFGQTWRRANATHIVPGFASMYRATVLPKITINPVGLVIEDFNMTFEVYRKGLGRVGFALGAKAVTQDPTTLHDYIKQTRRWALGLWQTVRRHRLHLDLLSAMICVLLLELVTASLILLVLPLIVIVLAVPDLFPAVLHWPAASVAYSGVADHVSLRAVLLGVLVPDLVLTLVVVIVERQPRYLIYGLFFVFMRTIDAGIALYTLPRAWREQSTGRWVSPARRDPLDGTAATQVTATQVTVSQVTDARPGARPAAVAPARQATGADRAGADQTASTPQAAGRQPPAGLGQLSAITFDPPELAEVRTWWTRAAEAADTYAQNNVPVLLATGADPPELPEIRRWWTRAAEAGDPEAQNNLGVLLATEADPPELAEARRWWTAAAEAGHAGAQNNLGVLLASLVDPPELAEARRWWTAAAEAGHAGAQNNLRILLDRQVGAASTSSLAGPASGASAP